ncbi:MAG: hypothetical protein RBS35_05695 [Azonexus sp.]|jgi:hypothetical protein|nr:hypothetical protein [Azonexus sp.]
MIKVKLEGLDVVAARLAGMGKQVDFAAATALNKTAFDVRNDVYAQMRAVIAGGPTVQYTLKSFRVEKASKQSLAATVGLRTDSPGKGSRFDKTLAHLFTGGNRNLKRMERAFQAAGILPSGMFMVIPNESSWAIKINAHGNPDGGFVTQLIAYFNAFGEQGYKANMTDKRRGELAKKKQEGGYMKICGVVYFISTGRGQTKHLQPGIWAKRGTHGIDVAPVFLFVRRPQYKQLFDLEAIANKRVKSDWQANFSQAFAKALRTAR